MTAGYTWRFTTTPVCFSEWCIHPDPFAAFLRAAGPILHRQCADSIDSRDASDMLRTFARECARDVAHMWDAPPVVLEWLETGDESIRLAAARAARAARDIYHPAVLDRSEAHVFAAGATLCAATYKDGFCVCEKARESASCAAHASSLATEGGSDAARSAQRARLNRMAAELFEGAGE